MNNTIKFICLKCGKGKPRKDFLKTRDISKPTRLQCKACISIYTVNRKRERIEELKNEPIALEAFREKQRIYDRNCYYKNHEERKRKSREIRKILFLKDPEIERSRSRKYSKTIKGKLNSTKHWNKRRAKIKELY